MQTRLACSFKMEDKADEMKLRLEKRQEARLTELEKRRNEAAATSDERESVAAFNEQFSSEKDKITKLFEHITEVGLTERNHIVDKFDEITGKMLQLQKYVSDSAMFLPSYELRQFQVLLQRLQKEIDEKRDELLPKKKFAFRSKSKLAQTYQSQNHPDVEKSRNNELPVQKYTNRLENSSNAVLEQEDQYGFHNKSDCDLNMFDCKNSDVKLSKLTNCTVKIFGTPSALHVDNLLNCVVMCAPISRAAFVNDCNSCVFVLACQQLRIHSTYKTEFYIHVTGKAIIEDCDNVGFAPYCWEYDKLEKNLQESGLNSAMNKWDQVDDFNWLKFDEQSPHWNIITEGKRKSYKE